jgi:hypothetical protein
MPLQLSEMELLNDPDCGFAVTVRVPEIPAGIVSEAGDALKDRVGLGGGPAAALGQLLIAAVHPR